MPTDIEVSKSRTHVAFILCARTPAGSAELARIGQSVFQKETDWPIGEAKPVTPDTFDTVLKNIRDEVSVEVVLQPPAPLS